MVFVVTLVGLAVTALAHTLPGRFLLDVMAGDRAVWHMSRDEPATIYLTFDDGPNPSTTPDLLDLLADEGVPATFFLIDAHVTDETAPLVRRMFDEGHAVGIHSATRAYMLLSPDDFASTLTAAADRIEQAGGTRPCRAFRPHAGWRGGRCTPDLTRRTIGSSAGAGTGGTGTGSGGAPRKASSTESPRAPRRATSSCCTTATSRRRGRISGRPSRRRRG